LAAFKSDWIGHVYDQLAHKTTREQIRKQLRTAPEKTNGPVQTKHWIVTSFRMTDKFEQNAPPSDNYVTYQHEICPHTNRPHIQGYVELQKKTTATGLKKMLGKHVFATQREGTR
jgi:hypothetical protein